MDRSEARRVLGVDREASEEKIREAYEDLRKVWDPGQYPEDERLRTRAVSQRADIEQAYRVLTQSPPGRNEQSGDLYGQIFVGRSSQRKPASPSESAENGSLLSQTISTRERPSKVRHPVWISAGVFLLLVVAVLVAQFVPTQEVPSGLPGLLEEGRTAATSETAEPADVTAIAGSAAKPQEQPAAPPEQKTKARRQASPGARTEAEPPERVEPKETPPTNRRSENRRPVLVRQEASETSSRPAEPQQSKTPPTTPPAADPVDRGGAPEGTTEESPGPDPEALAAFTVLKAKSEGAVRLLANLIDEFEFQEWKPVQKTGDSILIDLQALRKNDQQLVHFIWAVDVKADTARPLSQAARDLETRLKPP